MNDLQKRLADALETAKMPGQWWGPAGGPLVRFYFGDSAQLRKDGKPVRGSKVWLQFDDPETLEGVALRAMAKKHWHQQVLAERHAEAVAISIEIVDPAAAARLRQEIADARAADEPIGDLVDGEDE